MSYIVFLVSAVVIAIAGTYLAKYGDVIAEETGLTGVWIGAVLVAAATSLPEIASDVTAGILSAPDLAAGDIFGSGMANMVLLAIISFYFRRLYRGRLLSEVTIAHSATAALSMLLTGLAGFFIAVRLNAGVLNVGFDTMLIVVIYVVAMWTLLGYVRSETRVESKEQGMAEKEGGPKPTMAQAVAGFAASTVAIIIAAPFLISSAQRIVELTGIGSTFMGTLFLAIVTSAPELSVSLSAIRLGAFDLAVGDLFGSNAFNIVILFATDIAFRKGYLLSSVSTIHQASAFLLLVLMSIGLAGLVFRAKKKYFLIAPDAILIITAYVLGMWMIFRLSVY